MIQFYTFADEEYINAAKKEPLVELLGWLKKDIAYFSEKLVPCLVDVERERSRAVEIMKDIQKKVELRLEHLVNKG